jgi:hypothetical protein
MFGNRTASVPDEIVTLLWLQLGSDNSPTWDAMVTPPWLILLDYVMVSLLSVWSLKEQLECLHPSTLQLKCPHILIKETIQRSIFSIWKCHWKLFQAFHTFLIWYATCEAKLNAKALLFHYKMHITLKMHNNT